ncbi:MAG: hypothetical protein IJC46_03860 [Clostridia bacterium]|nr:hypothetical protein [Clostridia bacterium]
MDISTIDKNFLVQNTINKEDVVFYDAEQAPFKIYGIKREGEQFRRMPEAVARATSAGVLYQHGNTAGGRVRFMTDSPYIAIVAEYGPKVGKMAHFPFTGSIGFDLYTGKRYLKTFVPPFDIKDRLESVIDLYDPSLREYTINFPLYSDVKKLYIGLKEGSIIQEVPDYADPLPIVYYGSSITQGGCASRPGGSYQSIIGRELDMDHINLGFSGNAKAEDVMADYVASLDMRVFVYDYDHNAPNPAHLAATHEKMFKKVRAAHLDLPILMLTRPKYYLTDEEKERLAIVRQTYENALAAGDKNVYFIPGTELLMDFLMECALVDNCHPNQAGFASMAYVIGNKLKEILGR